MHAVGSWQNTEHAKFKWGEDFIIQRQVAVVVVVVFSTSDKPIEDQSKSIAYMNAAQDAGDSSFLVFFFQCMQKTHQKNLFLSPPLAKWLTISFQFVRANQVGSSIRSTSTLSPSLRLLHHIYTSKKEKRAMPRRMRFRIDAERETSFPLVTREWHTIRALELVAHWFDAWWPSTSLGLKRRTITQRGK